MSIFTMEHANEVLTMDLPSAQHLLRQVIDNDEVAKPVTRVKARVAVDRAKNTAGLATLVSGWLLAHPDENLKVL